MKQIIVNVEGLTNEEKQRVDEALIKIENGNLYDPTTSINWDNIVTMFGPRSNCPYVSFSYFRSKNTTHTPQQVLEMAGMVAGRKVRKDFDKYKEYSVNVAGCSSEEKKAIQQAFFDAGFLWSGVGKTYQSLNAAQYTNALSGGIVTTDLMFGSTTDDCNMSAKEFLELVYEQGHVHAEDMSQYAEDAKTTNKPWELWESKFPDEEEWNKLNYHPSWDVSKMYRRIPKTHIVNGFEIPDLRIEPKNGQEYWYPDPSTAYFVGFSVHGTESSVHRLANNLCYEHTEDGKQAAILHAKIMLGIA